MTLLHFLQSLVAAYLAPDTIDNQEVRQCLAYFFPVYCYSSAVNQRRMQRLFIGLFEQLAPETRNVDETQDMVSPISIISYTDPRTARWAPRLNGFCCLQVAVSRNIEIPCLLILSSSTHRHQRTCEEILPYIVIYSDR